MNALLVKDEAQRGRTVEGEDRISPGDDRALQDLVTLAAQICETQVAILWTVGATGVCVKATVGLSTSDLATLALPDKLAMPAGVVSVITDACIAPEFAPTGLRMGGEPFCFCAAAPIVCGRDAFVSTLAVMDRAARTLTGQQQSALLMLAREAAENLQLRERVRQLDRSATSSQRELDKPTLGSLEMANVLDAVSTLVIVFDPEGRILHFNKACETATGYTAGELQGCCVWERLIPDEQVASQIALFDQFRSDGLPTDFESDWICRDGAQRRIAWCGTCIRNPDGEVELVVASGTGATTRTAASLAGLTDEEKYRQLIEGSLGVVFTHDLDGRLLTLNTHGAASIGRRIDEMVGFPLERFVPAKRQKSVREYLKTITERGQAQGMMHLSHRDGDVRVLAYRNKLIADGSASPYVLGFGVDITDQVKAERKLRTLTRQSNSILEAIGDGIFCIDRDGRVTVVNAAAAQMLGYRQEEMLGRVMHSLIHHTRADGSFYPMEESPILKSISSFGTARVRDEVFWRKDGTSFSVEYVARPLIDANSSESGGVRALGVVVAFTDTTERKILDRMKDEFISTVSHELRTPLTSLRGALGLLRGGALEQRPEKSRQMLEIAIKNADRLARLVNDIVDLERISSGKNELHVSLVRARELLHSAVNVSEAQMQGSSARIRLRPTELSVWADSERIVQVLNNLLSNAFKFSKPDGEVHIAVWSIDDQEALFEVRDFGRGISPDKLEHIFDRFHLGDASDSRALGGTGLGLTICRRIISLHGGRIWASSTPGEGTTVHFTLPTRPRMNL
jgi:PAS domain S-box-containing protein